MMGDRLELRMIVVFRNTGFGQCVLFRTPTLVPKENRDGVASTTQLVIRNDGSVVSGLTTILSSVYSVFFFSKPKLLPHPLVRVQEEGTAARIDNCGACLAEY
jgi:hypothetical protein